MRVVSLLSFVRSRDFGSELVLNKFIKCLIIFVYLKLISSTLENGGYKVKGDLAKTFKEQDIFLSVVLQLFIADEIRNMNE